MNLSRCVCSEQHTPFTGDTIQTGQGQPVEGPRYGAHTLRASAVAPQPGTTASHPVRLTQRRLQKEKDAACPKTRQDVLGPSAENRGIRPGKHPRIRRSTRWARMNTPVDANQDCASDWLVVNARSRRRKIFSHDFVYWIPGKTEMALKFNAMETRFPAHPGRCAADGNHDCCTGIGIANWT